MLRIKYYQREIKQDPTYVPTAVYLQYVEYSVARSETTRLVSLIKTEAVQRLSLFTLPVPRTGGIKSLRIRGCMK